MLNKVLYVARKAKGLTEGELAKVLAIEENEYKELEHRIKRMTIEWAEKLGSVFHAEPDYFMVYENASIQDLRDVLKKQRELLNLPEYTQSEGRVHIALARMAIEASIALQENYILLKEQRELKNENRVLRELYEDLKNRNLSKPARNISRKMKNDTSGKELK